MNLPPYKIYPSVSGTNVSLRQLRDADINDLIQISFYNSVQATTLEEALEISLKIEQDYAAGNTMHWGIADNQTNKIVGTCGYYRGFDKEQGELGCVLLPQYRGQGFMASALALAIGFGINQMGLHRIWAATSSDNEKAIKLLEKLNFVKSRTLADNEVEYELPAEAKV